MSKIALFLLFRSPSTSVPSSWRRPLTENGSPTARGLAPWGCWSGGRPTSPPTTSQSPRAGVVRSTSRSVSTSKVCRSDRFSRSFVVHSFGFRFFVCSSCSWPGRISRCRGRRSWTPSTTSSGSGSLSSWSCWPRCSTSPTVSTSRSQPKVRWKKMSCYLRPGWIVEAFFACQHCL